MFLLFGVQNFRMIVVIGSQEARWPSGRASDSGARGRGSILTQVAVLCP